MHKSVILKVDIVACHSEAEQAKDLTQYSVPFLLQITFVIPKGCVCSSHSTSNMRSNLFKQISMARNSSLPCAVLERVEYTVAFCSGSDLNKSKILS